MKNILIITFLLFYINNVKAQKKNKLDTVYVVCQQDKLHSKYHFMSPTKDSFYTVFSFKVDWELYGYKKKTFEFEFNSKSEHYEPASNFFVKIIDTIAIRRFKNLYTLEQFTKALNEEKFLVPIFNGKVQIIMLYGASCLNKVEVYPVEVITNLSSEG
ncbi:hypothetical protein [Pedobacter nanyangensis]|uniref:hypothetical protein n=1 Tax=Pedobacter nanyangensis TaxID=1562389 RepID=UPI0013B43264|nr:hypothetical protein [Pedobacter nanyangensis]